MHNNLASVWNNLLVDKMINLLCDIGKKMEVVTNKFKPADLVRHNCLTSPRFIAAFP
jgi:hypothetical protein